MDLRQLRYFSAIFERRNLSHAAQQCSVAASAISHHLGNLETELGVALFERQTRGMEPTPAGSRLYEHAQTILRSVAAAAVDVSALSEKVSGDIHIGLPYTVIDAVGMAFLVAMREHHPGAKVIVQEALSSELQRQLLRGEIDLALCYNTPADDRLKLVHVHEEELCAVGGPALLGHVDAPIDVVDALALPQILLKRGAASRSISTQARLLESLHAHAVLEINSVNGMHKALAAGIGVAVCPVITVRDLIRDGIVIARPLRHPASRRSLNIVRLAERLPTRLMETVQMEILVQIQNQTDAGLWPIVN